MASPSSAALSELDPVDIANLYSKSNLVVFTIIVLIVSLVAISLRLWARYLSTGLRFGWDDWLALSAVPCFIAICALFFAVANKGVGDHIWMTPPEKTSRILMFLYIGSLIWNVGTSLIRFSVMTFYGRIFRVRGNANSAWVWFYNFVLGIVAVWAVAVLIFDALFECEPIAKFWRPSPLFEDPGSCIEPFVVFLVGSVGNFTVDVLVLIVPMPQVFKLNLPLVKKLGLAFSFVLGYGVAFLSLGRMIMALQIGGGINTDPTFYIVAYLYWNIAEIGLSIVAVCLPAIFQLSRQSRRAGVKSILRSKSSFVGSEQKKRVRIVTDHRHPSRNAARFVEPKWNNIYDGAVFGTFVHISTGSPIEYGRPRENDPLAPHGVHVREEISIAMQDMV